MPTHSASLRTVHSSSVPEAFWKVSTADWMAFDFTSPIGSSRSYWDRSMPIQPDMSTRPPSGSTYCARSSYLARASSSVAPVTIVCIAKIFTSYGSRPASTRAWRIFFTVAAASSFVGELMNTASACLPAKARPRVEAPAW